MLAKFGPNSTELDAQLEQSSANFGRIGPAPGRAFPDFGPILLPIDAELDNHILLRACGRRAGGLLGT